jgi:hypothetical protein
MDVEVADEAAAVDRLVQLGASVLWREDFGTRHWTVLADPRRKTSLRRPALPAGPPKAVARVRARDRDEAAQ